MKSTGLRTTRRAARRRRNLPYRKAERKARAEARVSLAAQDQWRALDSRFGKGKGATKERAKLLRKLRAA